MKNSLLIPVAIVGVALYLLMQGKKDSKALATKPKKKLKPIIEVKPLQSISKDEFNRGRISDVIKNIVNNPFLGV